MLITLPICVSIYTVVYPLFLINLFIIDANFTTKVKYPFSKAVTTGSFGGIINSSNKLSDIKAHFDPINKAIDDEEYNLSSLYMQAGQFFVVWGIFSIFYGIIALIVYMLTTANTQMEWLVNYLVLSVSQLIIM